MPRNLIKPAVSWIPTTSVRATKARSRMVTRNVVEGSSNSARRRSNLSRTQGRKLQLDLLEPIHEVENDRGADEIHADIASQAKHSPQPRYGRNPEHRR